MRKTNLRFDIAPLKSYYEKDGSTWINPNRQHADIYVFLIITKIKSFFDIMSSMYVVV